MSKAIIEIEKPKRCKDCFWYQADAWFGGSCRLAKKEDGWNKQIGADEEYDVQKWCPLLPKTEAIPIEWIKRYIDSTLDEGNSQMPGFKAAIIKEMVEEWEKENEIDRRG